MKEIAYKEWVAEEAQRTGRKVSTIYHDVLNGIYKGIRLRAVNERVIFVQLPAPPRSVNVIFVQDKAVSIPVGAISIKQWMVEESERLGIAKVSVFMRLTRGKYPNMERIRVGNVTRYNFIRQKTQPEVNL